MRPLIAIKHLSPASTEEEIIGVIDSAKTASAKPGGLLALLGHSHFIYRGRSLNEARRIRGYLMASFAHTGLSKRALPYILDELSYSIDVYTVAAAAIALRGLSSPYPQLGDYLLQAFNRVRHADDAVSFDCYKPKWPLETFTTASLEIGKTFQWMGSAANAYLPVLKELSNDIYLNEKVATEIRRAITAVESAPASKYENCCTISPHQKISYHKQQHSLDKILLEDQEMRITSYTSFFAGKPSLLAFFYTRCDNPNRCSLTVTKLGRLQRALEKENMHGIVRIAAITYDRFYDSSQRMKSYCMHRGFLLDDNNRSFRAVEGMDILLNYVSPACNYNENIVNHHGTELFLVNGKGAIKKRITGIEWDESKIVNDCRALLYPSRSITSTLKNALGSMLSVLFSAIVIFFPKCPFCAAAWLSILGISNMQFFAIKKWLVPFLITLLIVNLIAVYLMGKRRKNFLPFYLTIAGAVLLVASTVFPEIHAVAYGGLSIMVLASVLNGLPAAAMARQKLNSILHGGT